MPLGLADADDDDDEERGGASKAVRVDAVVLTKKEVRAHAYVH
jgi:hypothetical protein